ncbi:MAG: penicillin-insensitive murein endopeptidase [Vibrio gallaecicus]
MFRFITVFLGCWLISTFSLATPWESFTTPSTQPTQSIGSYANGCLAGADTLPLQGEGYQVIRPQRQRHYAHPNTITFIQSLAKELQEKGMPRILIADIAMARGGLFSFGHSSHQTGLDIDVWLRVTKLPLSEKELENPRATSVVDIPNYRINSHWKPYHFDLVKSAAIKEDVARIFVHPVIKEALCATETQNDREWLRKVRPWFGHHSHMHIRLKCSEEDIHCVEQAQPPEGDGCGEELASWKPKKGQPADKPNYIKKAKKKPELCQALLRE